ncbi:MAG TPA: hypothetical protein VM012_03495 [Flavitalea sp.]|nr:hypothetical protein [Flavitalea sp.]
MSTVVEYLKNSKIDRVKWDQCIDSVQNGLIYGYSTYLDQMARHWDALVMGDYERVMPLTWNKKFGISYLYQPPFTASLGLFGNEIDQQIMTDFWNAIPSKFRLIDISLNPGNNFEIRSDSIYRRINYILDLNHPYQLLRNGYRQNTIRNMQKSMQAGCTYHKNIPVKDVIDLAKQYRRAIPDHLERFERLYNLLKNNGEAVTRGIFSASSQLLASAVFFFSHGRAYYILVGNHPNGKTLGASHFLIDRFIEEHSDQSLLLDFEGSDLENLAFFYSSFGAATEIYPAVKMNHLPWWFKWLKR